MRGKGEGEGRGLGFPAKRTGEIVRRLRLGNVHDLSDHQRDSVRPSTKHRACDGDTDVQGVDGSVPLTLPLMLPMSVMAPPLGMSLAASRAQNQVPARLATIRQWGLGK
jgi:hypothetical protein